MKYQEYTSLICKMLGDPIVNVEVIDSIKSYIDIAFLEIKPHISTTKYLTVPYSPVIDLTGKSIYTVVSIFDGDIGIGTNGSTVSDDNLLFASLTGLNSSSDKFGGISTLDDYAIRLLSRQLTNTITGGSNLDFVHKSPFLYVTQSSGMNNITIEYIPDYSSPEDITEPFWTSLLFRLSLAQTKIAIGRARGKFRVSNLPYETDADTILNEGISEVEAIRSSLDDSNDIFFPLD